MKVDVNVSRSSSLVLVFFSLVGLFASGSLAVAADDAGQKAFLKEKCDRCHAISSLGIEARDPEEEGAPDMSNAAASLPSAEWITNWVLRKETKDGKKHSKPYQGSKKNLAKISEWLMTLETS